MFNNSKDLIPSEDEVKKILVQIMRTDPAQAPIVLLQLELAKLMFKFIDKLGRDLSESIERLESEIDREPKK